MLESAIKCLQNINSRLIVGLSTGPCDTSELPLLSQHNIVTATRKLPAIIKVFNTL